MKKFKKIMAVLVAAIMVVAMTVPAWAAEDSGKMSDTSGDPAKPEGSITITNVKDGETYRVYRLFDLASFTDTNPAAGVHNGSYGEPAVAESEAYSYVIREGSAWWEFLTSTSYGSKYAAQKASDWTTSTPEGTDQLFWIEPQKVTLMDATGTEHSDYHVITATTKFDNAYDVHTATYPYDDTDYNGTTTQVKTIQEFAKAAAEFPAKYAAASGTKDLGQVTVPNSGVAADTNDITISYLPLGYYLVTSTEGTLCSLDTTNKSVTIYDKNEEPTIDKKVLKKHVTLANAIESDWVDNADANIGDKVYFRTQIHAYQGAKNYVLHDIMEDGFTFGTDTSDDVEYGKIEQITLTRSTGVVDDPDTATVDESKNVYVIPAKGNKGTEYDGTALGEDYNNYTVTPATFGSNMADGCDFEIKFLTDKFAAGLGSSNVYVYIKDDDIITVYYSATLNENATVWNTSTVIDEEAGTDNSSNPTVANVQTTLKVKAITNQPNYKHNENGRNDNWTILTYGNESFTSFKEATVTTYQIDIVKTKDKAEDPDLLAGAKFSLYRAVKRADANVATSGAVGNPVVLNGSTYDLMTSALKFEDASGSYRHNANGALSQLTSTAISEIHVTGIEAGLYILQEDEAPLGYNKLANPIAITIIDKDAAGATPANEGTFQVISVDNKGAVVNDATASNFRAWDASLTTGTSTQKQYDTSEGGGFQIVNTTSTELPSTGGMGTTVLYIVGGMLVILAGAYLFFSRKKTA